MKTAPCPILLGNGDGTFQTPVPYTSGTGSVNGNVVGYVVEADLNRDGILDLVTSNNGDGTVSVFLGNGDGTFQAQQIYTAGPGALGLALGDLNGDGFVDLVVASDLADTSDTNYSLFILLGNGDGSLQAPTAVQIPPVAGAGPLPGTNELAIADFNGDGKLDVVAAYQSNGVALLLGNGDGTFQTPAVFAGTDYAFGLPVGNYRAADGLGIAGNNYDGNTTDVLLQSVTISPITLNFGSEAVGSSTTPQPFTITNTTVATVTLSPVTIAGTNAADFVLNSSCGGSLAPGGSCGVTVAYAPLGAHASTAALTFTDSGVGSPQTVPLSGTGTGQSAASLSSNALTFTSQLVGSTSGTQSVTLTNTGNLTLNITSIALTGANPGDFGESSNCGTTLAPAGMCSITVDFAPIATGSRSAAVTITDDAPNSPQSIGLTGTGIQAAGSLSGNSLTFTNQNTGTTSAPQPVTLTNNGSAPLTISSISASGDFGETNNCGSSVAVSSSCTIQVTFTPTASGTRTGTLTINDSDPSSPQTVALSGTGVALPANPVPFLTGVTPATFAPGSAQTTVTVTGTGFNSSTHFFWSGVALGSTTLSATQASVTIPAVLLAAPASAFIYAEVGGGGTSNPIPVQVATPNQNISFASTNYAGGTAPVWVAQVSHGTIEDLVMTNYFDGSLSYYKGNNDGTFGAQQVISVGSGSEPVSVAVGDVNNDGNLDLIVGHDDPVGGLSILLSNGDGTFQSPINVPLSSAGDATYDIVLGDFNGDGKLDIAVTNYLASTVTVLLGNGDGTFQTGVPYSTSSNSLNTTFYLAAADLNGDGKIDLLASNEVDGTIAVLLGNGDGTFQAAVAYHVANQPEGIAVADLNGDNKLDVLVADANSNFIGELIGNGDGTFQPVVGLNVGTPTTAVSLADMNADGKLDMVAAPVSSGFLFIPGNGDGTFQPPQAIPGATSVYNVVIGNFDPPFGFGLAGNDYNNNQMNVQLQTMVVTPVSLTFASQVVGTASVPQTITLTNSTVGTVTFTPFSISGTNSGDFSDTTTCSTTLAPGASCTVTVTYSPLAGGASSATLNIGSNGPLSPQSIPLSGTATAVSAVSLSSSNLVFTGVNLGVTSPAQTVTLTNTGSATLNITSIAVGGTNSGDFSQTNTCGATLAVNANCSINVTFTPSASGARSASVVITDDAPNSPQSITLTGNGLAATATLSAPVIAFGNQNVGATSASQSVTLTNNGNTALSITSIGVTGTNSGDFAQTNTCGSSVAASANCSITVTFTPSATGARGASIAIADSAAGSPQSVTLTGTGTASTVSLSATSLTFAAEAVGATSTAQSVTLTNTGNLPLTVTSIAVAGANSGDFAQTNNCGGSVAASGMCTINVTFTAGAIGNRSAVVAITDSATGSPQGIAVSGVGQGAAVSLSSGTLTFSGQVVNTTSASQSVTLTNTGNVALAVTSIAVAGANHGDFAETNNCGASLAASAMCSISITFTPTAGGARAASISITDAASGSPQSITLTGTGEDFALMLSSPMIVISSGSANITATLTSSGGFSQPTSLTCTGAPTNVTCNASPAIVTPTPSGATSTVSIVLTTSAGTLPQHAPGPGNTPWNGMRLWGELAALLLAATLLAWQRPAIARLRPSTVVLGSVLLLAAAGLTACTNGSGGFGTGPAPGTYTITVTGTSGAVVHSATFQLTIN